MKKVYTLFKKQMFLVISCFSLGLLPSARALAQCGNVVEPFNNGAGGFIGDLSYDGTNKRMVRTNVIGTAVYSITTPTFQIPNGTSFIGYGFTLDGTEHVSRVEVKITFVSTFTNQPTTFFLEQFVPNYGSSNTASPCRSVSTADLPGFPTTNGKYILRIELTTGTGTGGAAQTVTFDDFRTNGTQANAPLPVNFVGFDARKTSNGNQLSWKVAAEQNVNHYEVERSEDGRNFTSVYSVLAIKRDTYTYLDPNAGSTAYYRIKDVDNDGHFKYSNIARIVNGQLSIVIKAFPQPVINQLTVQHSTISSTTGLLTISSADGRIVSVVRPAPGSMQTNVDMTKLQNGLYVVRFDDGNGATETMKVVKQ